MSSIHGKCQNKMNRASSSFDVDFSDGMRNRQVWINSEFKNEKLMDLLISCLNVNLTFFTSSSKSTDITMLNSLFQLNLFFAYNVWMIEIIITIIDNFSNYNCLNEKRKIHSESVVKPKQTVWMNNLKFILGIKDFLVLSLPSQWIPWKPDIESTPESAWKINWI